MKDSQILEAARWLIESGEQDYICYAIEDAVPRPISSKHIIQVKSLTRWVRKMLYPLTGYDEWLLFQGYSYSRSDKRQGRLAWLDWMIAECEKAEIKIESYFRRAK